MTAPLNEAHEGSVRERVLVPFAPILSLAGLVQIRIGVLRRTQHATPGWAELRSVIGSNLASVLSDWETWKCPSCIQDVFKFPGQSLGQSVSSVRRAVLGGMERMAAHIDLTSALGTSLPEEDTLPFSVTWVNDAAPGASGRLDD